MVTFSQPLISQTGKFLGVTTIDITVDALCYGEQCNQQIDYNYLTKIRPVGLTFAVIAMASCFACGNWSRMYRRNRVVVASQPIFLRLICIGCLVVSSSIIPLSIDDSIASPEGCSTACTFPWLLSIGFTQIFAALFSKIWRLNKLFDNARYVLILICSLNFLRLFLIGFQGTNESTNRDIAVIAFEGT